MIKLLKYLFAPKHPRATWFQALSCRWRGHPGGVLWYNIETDVEEVRCFNCGDILNG